MSIDQFNQLVKETNERSSSPKRRCGSPEHDLQVVCVNWFGTEYPRYRELLWATPNGGQRNSITAARLKAEGARAGVPDLFLAVPCKGSHGLFIEMKNGKKGRLSEEQKKQMERLTGQGYRCVVCRSWEEFRREINQYLCV